jgi:hypothetical protein
MMLINSGGVIIVGKYMKKYKKWNNEEHTMWLTQCFGLNYNINYPIFKYNSDYLLFDNNDDLIEAWIGEYFYSNTNKLIVDI